VNGPGEPDTLAGSGTIRRWLKLEGVAALVAAGVLYFILGYGWLMFAVLFLVPDLSFLGYLRDPRTGAVIYNLFHSYAFPVLTAGVGAILGDDLIIAVSLIWVAHIGFDRALGYGLKLPTGFHDTHLGRIGRPRIPD